MIRPLPTRRTPPRRLVLVAAALAGLVAAAALGGPAPGSSHDAVLQNAFVAQARAQPAAPDAGKAAPEAPKAATPPADTGAAAKDKSVDAEITIDDRGVTVRKGKRGKPDIVIDDHEFESFEQFVEQAPWLAGLVFMVTALVFLVPLIVIVLVVWYKMRRTRMINETMLRLAERGVVPPAEAMSAIASGRPGPALDNVPPSAPLYQQAQALRKRASWSDLRKGVLIGGVGLGLALWGLLDDGSPNGLGLILLFVGIGYGILWYLEERPGQAARSQVPPPGGA